MRAGAAEPPSGQQVELHHGRQRLVVVSGGGGIRSYSAAGVRLVDGFAADEVINGARGQLLLPWPNRVRDGRYSFSGADQQLALTEPALGNAIHGLVRGHTWQVASRSDARAVLEHLMVAQMGYPWSLRLRVEYALHSEGLTVRVSATNVSAQPAPYGAGSHTYLRPGDGVADDWLLTVPASTHLLTDEQQVPVGEEPVRGTAFDFNEPRRIGDLRLDTAFTDLARDPDGRARAVLANPTTGVAVTVWMDASYGHLMVFTGDTLTTRRRRGVALEPMTCPPDALNSGRDLLVLQPGETHASEWGICPSGVQL